MTRPAQAVPTVRGRASVAPTYSADELLERHRGLGNTVELVEKETEFRRRRIAVIGRPESRWRLICSAHSIAVALAVSTSRS